MPPTIAFVDVTLLPMDREGAPPHQTVIVSGDRIVAVGPSRSSGTTTADDAVAVPADALRIEGAGRWLLPGLIDNHVHLFDERDLPLHLAFGVTTVRNLKGTPWHLELREELRRGERIGPRLLTAGPYVNEPDARTPDEVEAAVREQADLGYDCIKIHGRLQEESYERLVAVAEEVGLPVVGHVPRGLLLSTVLAIGGLSEISHVEELLYSHFDPLGNHNDPRAIDACVALVKSSGVRVTATLVAFENIAPQIDDLAAVLARPQVAYLPPLARRLFSPPFNDYVQRFSKNDAAALRTSREFQTRLVRALHEAGVSILLGTDCMIPVVVPGYAVGRELENLVDSGFTPWQALAAATVHNGDFLGTSPPIGRIAVDGAADLLLLDADPLADVAAVRRIVGVMSHGTWRTRAMLDALLAQRQAGCAREAKLATLVNPESPRMLLDAVREASRLEAEGAPPPIDEAFLTSVGQVYLSARLPQFAVEVLQRNVELFPQSPAAKRRLAEAQARVKF